MERKPLEVYLIILWYEFQNIIVLEIILGGLSDPDSDYAKARIILESIQTVPNDLHITKLLI